MRQLLFIAMLCLFASCAKQEPQLSVIIGPTPIQRGDALGAKDITVNNGLFAIAFAVETAPPWGVARGGIVDIALLEDGEPGYDIASLVDFMPNNWSSWPTTYQTVSVDSVSRDEVVIRSERDWAEVELDTTFTIKANDSRIHVVTHMTNKGTAALDDLLSGYVAWPDGGYLIEEAVVTGGDGNGWTAAYDENWMLGLYAPFSEHVDRRGRDRYTRHDLAAGETKTFEAWIQIESDGSLAPMVQTEIEFGELAHGRISGSVVDTSGESIASPTVIVATDGKPVAWSVGQDGEYQINLPVGEYEIYATAPAYAQSSTKNIMIEDGSDIRIEFNDVGPPGNLKIDVRDAGSGEALDARISIEEGQTPLIGYFGKKVYFTDLRDVGHFEQAMAPGNYVLNIASGGGFTSAAQSVDVVIESAHSSSLQVDIDTLAKPQIKNWYNADLHHHSDVLDGFTPAEYVMRSQLAAGVDMTFLSDHDSVVNNREMQSLSASRGMHFIAGTELSPSWGHFNAYPLDDDKQVEIDTGQATVQEIFGEARRLGAEVIAVNHGYSDYGYFRSHEEQSVPGNYDAGFDLVEIGPRISNDGKLVRNPQTIQRVWAMWNDGTTAYLAAGSDVHDVWNFESAGARSFVHVDGDLTIENFMAALDSGNAYASQGPLIYPEIMFGTEIQKPSGEELTLKYTLQSVTGLQSVKLIERGTEIDSLTFDGVSDEVAVEFAVHPEQNTWYSLVVEDVNSKVAYTNPVWVSIEGESRWH